jgi:hypothetical protein
LSFEMDRILEDGPMGKRPASDAGRLYSNRVVRDRTNPFY